MRAGNDLSTIYPFATLASPPIDAFSALLRFGSLGSNQITVVAAWPVR